MKQPLPVYLWVLPLCSDAIFCHLTLSLSLSLSLSLCVVHVSLCVCVCVCVCVCFHAVFQVSSQQVSSNCVIKREEEKCMEMIASDDPGNDPEFGRFSFFASVCLAFKPSPHAHHYFVDVVTV